MKRHHKILNEELWIKRNPYVSIKVCRLGIQTCFSSLYIKCVIMHTFWKHVKLHLTVIGKTIPFKSLSYVPSMSVTSRAIIQLYITASSQLPIFKTSSLHLKFYIVSSKHHLHITSSKQLTFKALPMHYSFFTVVYLQVLPLYHNFFIATYL